MVEKSLCAKLITEAHPLNLDKWTEYDLDTTVGYWLDEYPSISDRTRSGIVSMFTTTTDNFLRRPMRMLFSEAPEDAPNIAWPELTPRGHDYHHEPAGERIRQCRSIRQVVYKYIWQQAAERRDVKENPRPIFLWVDEAKTSLPNTTCSFRRRPAVRGPVRCI